MVLVPKQLLEPLATSRPESMPTARYISLDSNMTCLLVQLPIVKQLASKLEEQWVHMLVSLFEA